MSQQGRDLTIEEYENTVHGAGDEYRMMINRLLNTYKQKIRGLVEENKMLKNQIPKKQPDADGGNAKPKAVISTKK